MMFSVLFRKIIQKRLQQKLEEEINVVQAGFRPRRGTRDHIFNLRNILENVENTTEIYTHVL